jgi:GT2 family glycosyltransferase
MAKANILNAFLALHPKLSDKIVKLSIIIINYRSRDILGRCIDSIKTDFNHEIIIVDNDNDLPEIELKDNILILPYEGNLGFSGANNKALARASGEYVLFLNADVFLTEDYIDHCIRHLDSNPTCSSVQGKLLKESNPELIDSTGNVVTRSFWAFNEHHLDRDHPVPSHEIFGVCCAAGIFRRTMLDEIREGEEYFDESFFAYLEDVDLNIRLRKAGYSSWFESRAVALHIRESSSSAWFRLKQSFLNRYLLIVKHKGMLSTFLYGLLIAPIFPFLTDNPKLSLLKIYACHKKKSAYSENTDIKQHLDSPALFYYHSYNRLISSVERLFKHK